MVSRWTDYNRGNDTGDRPDFYWVDCANKEQMRQIFREHGIDAVVHFAGFKAVVESVKPLQYYRNNLDSTLTLLEVMVVQHIRIVRPPKKPHCLMAVR